MKRGVGRAGGRLAGPEWPWECGGPGPGADVRWAGGRGLVAS